jgi:hypothetical protein
LDENLLNKCALQARNFYCVQSIKLLNAFFDPTNVGLHPLRTRAL